MNTFKKIALSLGVIWLSVGFVSSAFAQTTATVSATATAKLTAAQTKRLATIIAQGDKAITDRIADLSNLGTRVDAIKNVSDVEKATLASTIQTQTDGLNALKTKLDAETDLTTAQADAKTVTGGFRIYALVVPQGMILASSDRVATIVGLMTTLGTKLQARITAASTAGKNVTAVEATLTDFNTKVADATTQAQTAATRVTSLTPDNGDNTIMASNKAALQAARADLKVATSDLKTARADVNTITKDLKAFKLPTTATATTTTTTTAH